MTGHTHFLPFGSPFVHSLGKCSSGHPAADWIAAVQFTGHVEWSSFESSRNGLVIHTLVVIPRKSRDCFIDTAEGEALNAIAIIGGELSGKNAFVCCWWFVWMTEKKERAALVAFGTDLIS